MAEQLNVFITGADSAVGRETARRLIAAGHRVTGVVSSADAANALRHEGGVPAYPTLTRAGEIRSILKAMDAQVIVHLAGQTPNHIPHLPEKWEAYEPLLTDGTTALLDAAAAAGIRYLIFGSYAFVYSSAAAAPADEDAPTGGDSAIIRAALKAEQAALAAAIPVSILRAGYHYGAHSPETLALRKHLKAGQGVFDSAAYANWVHVNDFAAAVLVTLEQQPQNEIFNIVDDQPATINAFSAYLAGAMHIPAARMPAFLQQARIGKAQAELLRHSARAANDKAKTALGWKPHYPTYELGLEQVLLVLRAEEPVY